MNNDAIQRSFRPHRRTFLRAVGSTGAIALAPGGMPFQAVAAAAPSKTPAKILGAFVYPPTEKLDKEGYYSWPGSTFGAEERQREYLSELHGIQNRLGIDLWMNGPPLDTAGQVETFVKKAKAEKPDGLLLIPFKKGHWPHVTRIVEETGIPTVVLATMGVLLVPMVRDLHEKPGVYMINSLDNLEAVEYGLTMIRAAKRMGQSLILNIRDSGDEEYQVPNLGTRVRTIPRTRFAEEFDKLDQSEEAEIRAARFMNECENIVEPSRGDILDAAKTYYVLKRLVEAEGADAMMMECLPGLKHPHMHVPPCMGFMDLRDEGIPAGCEADLDATLTMMLMQNLFNRPAFQHNPSVDTEKNLYFGAHCTCASKMEGPDGPREPFVLRNHAEAGWGCVPEVCLKNGQMFTMAKYLVDEARPSMILYTGKIVQSPCPAHTGGCRTNMMATINELDDVCRMQGHHLSLCYGDHGDRMKAFNRMYGIEVVV